LIIQGNCPCRSIDASKIVNGDRISGSTLDSEHQNKAAMLPYSLLAIV